MPSLVYVLFPTNRTRVEYYAKESVILVVFDFIRGIAQTWVAAKYGSDIEAQARIFLKALTVY